MDSKIDPGANPTETFDLHSAAKYSRRCLLRRIPPPQSARTGRYPPHCPKFVSLKNSTAILDSSKSLDSILELGAATFLCAG